MFQTHFIRPYNSLTVVDRVVRLTFVDSYSNKMPHASASFSIRSLAIKMVSPRCDDLSGLLLYEASGYPRIRTRHPTRGQNLIKT